MVDKHGYDTSIKLEDAFKLIDVGKMKALLKVRRWYCAFYSKTDDAVCVQYRTYDGAIRNVYLNSLVVKSKPDYQELRVSDKLDLSAWLKLHPEVVKVYKILTLVKKPDQYKFFIWVKGNDGVCKRSSRSLSRALQELKLNK